MSTRKINWPIPWNLAMAKEELIEKLTVAGYEVDTEEKNYRVLMFRKKSNQWTQIYTGLTCVAKKTRDWIKVTGPEFEAIPKYYFYDTEPPHSQKMI